MAHKVCGIIFQCIFHLLPPHKLRLLTNVFLLFLFFLIHFSNFLCGSRTSACVSEAVHLLLCLILINIMPSPAPTVIKTLIDVQQLYQPINEAETAATAEVCKLTRQNDEETIKEIEAALACINNMDRKNDNKQKEHSIRTIGKRPKLRKREPYTNLFTPIKGVDIYEFSDELDDMDSSSSSSSSTEDETDTSPESTDSYYEFVIPYTPTPRKARQSIVKKSSSASNGLISPIRARLIANQLIKYEGEPDFQNFMMRFHCLPYATDLKFEVNMHINDYYAEKNRLLDEELLKNGGSQLEENHGTEFN